jgi:hypothetical protein
MAKCTYCSGSAGILKTYHLECKQKNLDGWGKLVALATDACKATPIITSQMEFADSGLPAVTTENLYYKGQRKSFRIPYSKIVSFTQYSDGIGLQREAASARPQVFVTGDG